MGYQALLFCPDEKTARTVTQVLSELDFAVTPCTEPFAAVKRLMGEHFDAVVVDCDNEQNATLLFKSARNTSNNQSSLAVAIVEGQAGVAKAFRIGANLVLTKPMNVEQAKGTLRVARGLLRKNEAAKPATGAGTAASALSSPPKPAPQVTTPNVIPVSEKTAPRLDATVPEISSPVSLSAKAEPNDASGHRAEVAPINPAGSGTSAASAPATARERKDDASPESKPSARSAEHDSQAGKFADSSENVSSIDGRPAPLPTLTFGGTVGSETEPSGSAGKKAMIAIAAILLIAAGGYVAWMHWGPNAGSSAPAGVATQPAPTAAAAPKASPSSIRSVPSSSSESQTAGSADDAKAKPGQASGEANSSKPSAAVVENKAPASTPAEEKAAEIPIVLKTPSKLNTKPAETNDAPDLSIATIVPGANGSVPPNLLDSAGSAPTPVLQTVNISQGVSQGLLLKKVNPVYPPSALRLRTEGSVQLMATISPKGNISAVRIVSGDSQLAHAAADAVKQWKYKPYLLNGSPVEIQTQITVNFKLPK